MTFVPDDFEVPLRHATESFVLEPLGPEHNERDHDAWTSSIGHIRTTHGYAGRTWPRPMTPDENLRDLEQHREEFHARAAFAYTVLDVGEERVIGCVYVDPDPTGASGALLRTWVTESRAGLDAELRDTVRGWLEREWPFASVSCPSA